MKFKKVEIQAFRAYNKVEDGTFDFTTKSDEIADFISIYAPNGSGKTSFYDAIEWGFTRNISRFLLRRGEDKNFAKTEERNFRIRNKFAEINTDSFVRLHTTSKNRPFEETIGRNRANRSAFRFDEKGTVGGREYFRHVLLSQEWIDAFLKEDDASVRYEKFVRSFGDTNLNRKYKTITELIKLNNNKINELTQELQELQSKINPDSDNKILSKINSEIELLNKNGEMIPVVEYNWSEKEIQQLTDLISGRIIDLKYDAAKLREEKSSIDSIVTGNNISDITMESYFSYKEQIERIDKKLLELDTIKKQFKQISQKASSTDNLHEEIERLITILSDRYKVSSVADEIQQLENEKEALNRKLVSFEYFLKSEFEFDLSDKGKSELETFVKEKTDSCKKSILNVERLIQSFEKTEKYKDSVLPFLKYDEYKRTEDMLLSKKSLLEKNVHLRLRREQRKISKYIDKQIESFFNVKLINMLYRKIDPHPIYEEIMFKCDFSADKPQLNAFIVEEDDTIKPIVPSLYFSAAQLNTLSLSLFLSKALNVKDNKGDAVDCIFIDDPIQSMDSINILSMIDLLRSISVNLSKQIFLSTRDENLYNLLQKKIPSDRFNAKYIELETFGKVKS